MAISTASLAQASLTGRMEFDSDNALVKRAREGDYSAFERLFERHRQLVYRFAYQMAPRRDDAEDIVQEAFVRAYQNLDKYRDEAKFTTWLLKITRNLVFNEMRRAKRHPHLPVQIEPNAEEMPLKDEATASPDETLLQTELQQAIENAITLLPETQRMALVLRRYDELSYEEIADVLDLSVPAVKSLLFRARTELRKRLKDYLGR